MEQVYKSPDCFKAFAAAKDLIDSLVSGKVRPFLFRCDKAIICSY